MKHFIILTFLTLSLAACATRPVPADIQAKVDAVPSDQLPQHFFVEREMCGSKRGEKRASCIEKTRRDYLARELMREQEDN